MCNFEAGRHLQRAARRFGVWVGRERAGERPGVYIQPWFASCTARPKKCAPTSRNRQPCGNSHPAPFFAPGAPQTTQSFSLGFKTIFGVVFCGHLFGYGCHSGTGSWGGGWCAPGRVRPTMVFDSGIRQNKNPGLSTQKSVSKTSNTTLLPSACLLQDKPPSLLSLLAFPTFYETRCVFASIKFILLLSFPPSYATSPFSENQWAPLAAFLPTL